MPEEASDSLDVPPSPAPSEYGSYASSISRFRYSEDTRSRWASHNDLLIVQAFCICFHCSSLLSYNSPTLPLCWGNRQCGNQNESKLSVRAAPKRMMPYAHCFLYAYAGNECFVRHMCREVSQLAIGGLDLEPDLAKKILDTDAELAAAAVGYATRLTQRLAALLDVPLRYPLRFANSRSTIYSHAPPAGTIRSIRAASV